MLFRIIDSPGYMVAEVILGVFSLLSFLFAYYISRKKKKGEKKRDKIVKKGAKKERIEKLDEILKGAGEYVFFFLRVGFLCMICCSMLLCFKREYGEISQRFHSAKKYKQYQEENKRNELFKKEVREYANQEEWIEKAVHRDWYYEIFSEKNSGVTYAQIQEYQKRVTAIHKEPGYKKDIYIESEFIDESIASLQEDEEMKLYNVFKAAVGTPIAEWNSEDIWEAYKAGEELTKKNNTSAMVFQTAVLAEGAHENLYKESRGGENGLLYHAGAIKSFEEFLGFEVRDPGDGSIIPVSEVCFREGKIDYRQGIYLKEAEDAFARHFLVKAYAEFQFILESTDMDDKKYLTYLYYAGLSTLHIMSYIDDGGVKSDLCRQIVDKWDKFSEKYNGKIENITVENISAKRVGEVRTQLKGYIIDKN